MENIINKPSPPFEKSRLYEFFELGVPLIDQLHAGVDGGYYAEPPWLKQMEAERWVQAYNAIPHINHLMQANSPHVSIIPESYLKMRLQEHNDLVIAREKLFIALNIKYPLKKRKWRLRVKKR